MKLRSGIFLFIIFGLFSCEDDDLIIDGTLKAYASVFSTVNIHGVIACAASNVEDNRFDVYFYPTNSSSNFKYFESSSGNIDPWDYNLYAEFDLIHEEVFNGYIRKFVQSGLEENWGIVTFEKNGELYVSDPISNLPTTRPTEMNNDLISITENGITPRFDWQDGIYTNNDIYFQVILDENDNLISGTYTRDKNFTFYNNSNVVIDINEGNIPVLQINTDYKFVLMSVDDDNWVNVLAEKNFRTE